LGSGSNGKTFAVAFSQPGPWIGGQLGGSFSGIRLLDAATGSARDFTGGPFTVTMGARTATTQQVILSSTSNTFTFTVAGAGANGPGKTVEKRVPIKVTIVVNLMATPAPLPAGYPAGSTCNAATMTFKAVDASTGAPIVATDTLTGYTVAHP
jgi:hypothetical protein